MTIARLECRTGVWICKMTKNPNVQISIGLVQCMPVHVAYWFAMKWLAL